MEYYHSFSETGLIQITDSNQELIFEKQLRKKVNQELYRKLWNLIQTTFDDFQIFMNSDKTEWGFGSNLVPMRPHSRLICVLKKNKIIRNIFILF